MTLLIITLGFGTWEGKVLGKMSRMDWGMQPPFDLELPDSAHSHVTGQNCIYYLLTNSYQRVWKILSLAIIMCPVKIMCPQRSLMVRGTVRGAWLHSVSAGVYRKGTRTECWMPL